MKKGEFSAGVSEGLRYPWNDARKLWNILWIFVPILGWFGLVGYMQAIVKTLVAGNRKAVPAFGSIWHNFKEGLFVVIFIIPTLVVLGVLGIVPLFGQALQILVGLFILPLLFIDFLVTGKFAALWNVQHAFDVVVDNIRLYLVTLALSAIYWLVYWILSFVLVGIPCLAFGKTYYLTDFYRKHY